MALALGALGAISSFGTGAISGAETGMELYDQYATLQAQQLLGSSLGSLGGWAQPATGALPGPSQAAAGPSPAPPRPPSVPAGPYGPQQPMTPPPVGPPTQPQMADATGRLAAGLQAGGTWGSVPQSPGLQPQNVPMPPPRPPQAPQMPPQMPPRPPQQIAQQQPPSPPPDQERQDVLQKSTATPMEMMRFMQTGQGWMSVQELASRIEQANPNASPLVKFKALQMGAKLLNGQGSTQFSQMMQLIREERAQKHEERMETIAGQREADTKERLDIAETRALKQSEYYRTEEKQIAAAKNNLTATQLRMDKIGLNAKALKPIIDKIRITGNIKVDDWLYRAKAELGWPDATYTQYKTMLANLAAEMGAMSAQTLGALSVSAKEDGKALANGILTPTMLDSINEAIKIEGKNSNKAAKAIIDRHQKNLDYYMQTKGDMPPDVDEPDDDTATTAPPAATPTTAPGWGTATPVR